jgi:hypothetical protein
MSFPETSYATVFRRTVHCPAALALTANVVGYLERELARSYSA